MGFDIQAEQWDNRSELQIHPPYISNIHNQFWILCSSYVYPYMIGWWAEEPLSY